MADWTNIPDSSIDPDAPLTSELAYAWRENPIAIAEGATGAPRVLDIALQASNPTDNGARFVGRRLARFMSLAGAEIGTMVLAKYTGALPQVAYGTVVNGANLNPCSAAGGGPVAVTLSGSWVCLGYSSSGSTTESADVTLYCRVS